MFISLLDFPWEYPLLVLVGLVVGIINTMAGGGSLLTLPILIFLGLPSSVANGTNRIAIMMTAFSAWVYRLSLLVPTLVLVLLQDLLLVPTLQLILMMSYLIRFYQLL